MELKEEKEGNNSQLLNYVMHAGIILGLFWVFKYLFVIFGMKHPVMSAIGSMLSIGTPLLLFYLLVKYNTGQMDNKMRFGQGVQFSVLLFFFASILEALVVYIHIQWIDPAYITNLYESLMEMAKTIEIGKTLAVRMAEQPLPDPLSYIFSNVVMANVLLGLLLSLLIVPFALRYKSR